MRLTPLDIRHKEFARSMRGYKDLDVDEFLDDIADEFERVFNENIDHKERLEALEEKIEQYRNIEDTLKKTLLSAQQQAEEMKQNAKKEADLILRDAELKSRSIINDSYAERQKIQRSVAALKQKHEDLKYQLRSVIETYTNVLDQDEVEPLDEEEAAFAAETAAETAGITAGASTGATGLGIEATESAEASPFSTSMPGSSPAQAQSNEADGARQDDTQISSVDNAVSRELLTPDSGSSEAPPASFIDEPRFLRGLDDIDSGDKIQPSQSSSQSSTPQEHERGAKKAGDKEDPFADVEIDSSERKFDW